jgi:ferredoxin
MTKRKIIKINEDKCNGCGQCIPNCPEGALQIIEEKARIISDIFCDGLGACIGHCPQGAITIEEREAEPYDEKKVMKDNIIKSGRETIIAHLNHLKDHGEIKLLDEALEVLKEENIDIDLSNYTKTSQKSCSCPGTKMIDFSQEKDDNNTETGKRSSQLRQWPIQLHLVLPNAPYYQNKDVLLVADCVGYSLADFHKDFLRGKSITIACPKLDSNTDIYVDKIKDMINNANIKSLTVMTMQVPCCSGLLMLAKTAVKQAKKKIPLNHIMISIKGDILKKEMIN